MHSPRFLLSCLAASFTLPFSSAARAQVSADQTLGAEASVVTPDVEVRGGLADLIEGGAVRGTNLFHSFSDFNVLENQRVYFANPEGIESILSRVTGDRISNLFGILGVDGAANLFLINPNGFVFGPNVALDVEGSLYATTGDAIALGEGVFSAVNPTQSQLLSIAPSTSFFNYLTASSGNIVNQGQIFVGRDLSFAANNLYSQGNIFAVGNLTLSAGNTVQIREAAETSFAAFVRDGLLVVRALGDVDIESYAGGSLHVLSGGSVSLGTAIVFTSESNTLGMDSLKETIQLSDGTLIDIDGKAEPTVDIRAGVNPDQLSLSNKFNGETDTDAEPINVEPSSANISVKDIAIFGLNGSVLLTNQYFPNPKLEEGNIFVESERTTLDSGGGIVAGSQGGRILLDARNDITVIDSTLSTTSSSEPGRGINLLAGENIQFSSPLGKFTGVSIVADSTEQNSVSNIRIVADSLKITEGAQINTSTLNSTDAGDIIIFARNLEVANSAQLSAITFGEGRGGNVILNIGETAVLDGGIVSSGVGQGSKGKGGNVEINAANFEATNRAVLRASTLGEGAAGDINLNILGRLNIDNGTVETISLANSGGRINIRADSVVLRNDGDILTFVASGQGNGGKIVISSRYTIALEDSDILAFSADGRGGAIDLSQTTLFSQNLNRVSGKLTQEDLFALDGNNRVDINATGGIESGAISINDASFIENSLTELPDTLYDADVLVANSCIARSGNNGGTLTLTGRDRLPQSPNETLSTPYSAETVQPIPAETTLAEPQSVYRLADGRLMINRDCDQ